jgi:polyisoprenyl-teichoic acid--peptidoglycan teichoic acid transferase
MARPPLNSQSPKKPNKPKRRLDGLTFGLLVAFAILAIATGITAFVLVRNLALSWTSTKLPGAPVIAQSDENLPEQGYIPQGTQYTVPLQESEGPTPVPWDGASRVTILVMGLDYRDWEAGDIPRTDSMMLLTLDPVTYTAGMLSIPRDMWVNIPGFDYGKINTAYFLGESYHLPGGGPGLAVQTVEEFLGVPINYYAQIDFSAFVKFIDEIGGIDVNVPYEIVVDPIGQGNTITLRPGVQTLDGATALAYARNRHTDGGDFDRAQRQQQVIMAVLDDILNFYSLPRLVSKAPDLYNEISSGVRTNLNLQQAIQLAWIVQQIPQENIKQAVIGPDVVTFDTSPDGLSILIPIPDEIRILRDSVFTTSGPVGPAAVGNDDPVALMQTEAARIIIQNGTGVEGLANTTTSYFSSQGIVVVGQTNADRFYDASEIILYNGKPYTAAYLATLMNIPASRIYNQYNPDAEADMVIILGNDWATSNPMQ